MTCTYGAVLARLIPSFERVASESTKWRHEVMERRTFMAVVSGGLLVAPLAAHAQQAGRVYKIGYLGVAQPAPADSAWEALLSGLRERGYVEGQNIVLERRYSEGREDRYPAFVAELVQIKVDVILVSSTKAARAAMAATSSIPIVLVGVLDPERTGLVKSLGRPGGNVTGISNQLLEVQAK